MQQLVLAKVKLTGLQQKYEMLENLDESIADKQMIRDVLSVQIALQDRIPSPATSLSLLMFPDDSDHTLHTCSDHSKGCTSETDSSHARDTDSGHTWDTDSEFSFPVITPPEFNLSSLTDSD